MKRMGDMADTRQIVLSHWGPVVRVSGFRSAQRELEVAGTGVGIPGRGEALSVSCHLLGCSLGLAQGSEREQSWRGKAKILLRGVESGSGGARAVRRGSRRCSK